MKSKDKKLTASQVHSFEEAYPVIKSVIEKQRGRWQLTALNWIDYDDVSQIILFHIFKKWAQYNREKSLSGWVNVITQNQIRNLLRNNYSNFSRPCLKCDAAEEPDGCKIYTKQCTDCPLFKEWKKRKENAYNIKLPLSIENHFNEVSTIFDETSDISDKVEKIHQKMREILKPLEYKVYEGLFVLNEDEKIVAKKLGYTSNERGRSPGYKQLKNIRKVIITKIQKCIENGELDV